MLRGKSQTSGWSVKMALSEREVDIRVGRRETDGRVRVSVFAGELLAITVEGYGERAPTLVLTPEQARKLRDALGVLIPLLEDAPDQQEQQQQAASEKSWQGVERRSTGELR
jgi:hypothetical protein